MYFTTSKTVQIGDDEVVVEEGDYINLHLDGIYLMFTPEEWDKLVIGVAKARGLEISEHPFSGATLVALPATKEKP